MNKKQTGEKKNKKRTIEEIQREEDVEMEDEFDEEEVYIEETVCTFIDYS